MQGQVPQIRAVLAVAKGGSSAPELFGGDPVLAEGNLLQAGDLQALSPLQRRDIVRGIEKRPESPGIELGEAAAERLDSCTMSRITPSNTHSAPRGIESPRTSLL